MSPKMTPARVHRARRSAGDGIGEWICSPRSVLSAMRSTRIAGDSAAGHALAPRALVGGVGAAPRTDGGVAEAQRHEPGGRLRARGHQHPAQTSSWGPQQSPEPAEPRAARSLAVRQVGGHVTISGKVVVQLAPVAPRQPRGRAAPWRLSRRSLCASEAVARDGAASARAGGGLLRRRRGCPGRCPPCQRRAPIAGCSPGAGASA